MACAKPWFWERLHSAAAEHARSELRPALDHQAVRPPHQFNVFSAHVGRDDPFKALNTMAYPNGKESKHDFRQEMKQERLGKSLSATYLSGSSLAKPTPPAPIIPHRPEAPAPTRFQPQALGILPQKENRGFDRQQASWERPRNDAMHSQSSLDRQGRSQSCGTLSNVRVEKNMKDTRSLLNALVKAPICELRDDFAEPATAPYHTQRFEKLGDRMQYSKEADVRQLLSKTASFHRAKQDICAASTQPGSLATSLSGSSRSSPRLGSKHLFA